jgi:hypothetical protein
MVYIFYGTPRFTFLKFLILRVELHGPHFYVSYLDGGMTYPQNSLKLSMLWVELHGQLFVSKFPILTVEFHLPQS